MARIIKPAWERWGRRLAIIPALAMLATLVLVLPAQAINGFESADGNLANNGSTDWNNFSAYWHKIVTETGVESNSPTTTAVAGFSRLTWVEDRVGNPDDIFGGGVKQDDNCPSTKNGSLGAGGGKFDLERIYAVPTSNATGDQYLFIAWERVPQSSTTASAHIAFEFNKGTTKVPPVTGSVNCGGGGPGNPDQVNRTPGDRLIEYDFEGGSGTSTLPTLKLATWLGASDTGFCQVASHVPPCWGDPTATAGFIDLTSLGSDTADARVNTVDLNGGLPVTDSISGDSPGPVEFGEAGIDLSKVLTPSEICSFSGWITGVSRSSGDAGTAQMKDKVGKAPFSLPGCVASTAITSKIILNDTATITGFNSQGAGDGTGSLTFKLYKEAVAGTCDPSGADTLQYTDTVNGSNTAGGLTKATWTTVTEGNNVGGFTVATAGTYYWTIAYSGDSTNLPSSSICHEIAAVSYPT